MFLIYSQALVFSIILKVRGRDYAIDLCGVLDILKTAVTLIIHCQAFNLPPWKIVRWFPGVIKTLNGFEESLKVLEGDRPNEDLLPRLCSHWDELTFENAEDCHFHCTTPLLEGWLVAGKEGRTLIKIGKINHVNSLELGCQNH